MLKRMVMAAMLLSVSTLATAQGTSQEKGSHYLSLQANPLVSQIFNFGNPIPISNPYLVKYSYRFAPEKSGITAGIGYRSLSSKNEKDGFESKTTDFDIRAGYEWYVSIGDRFLVSVGPDLIFNGRNSKTVSASVFGSSSFKDSTVIDTYSQGMIYGGGARLNFSVAITPKILIGTESTFYYRISTFKSISKIERFRIDGGSQSIFYEKNETNEKGSDSNIQLPVAIFLTFKF